MKKILVEAGALARFASGCFVQLGLGEAEAALIADSLLFANLRGVDSHGIIRLKIYCERLRAGGFNAAARVSVLRENVSTALLDGHNGFGQLGAVAAMDRAVAMAGETGIGFVAVRNSNHFGASAFYALRAVKAGMVGLAATNTGPTMAPSGGREKRLGNNALALAIPAGKHPPLILDMAMGAAAWGKIFVARQEKKKIPASWALDKHGVPTDDPDVAADGGLIQPFGGYKGYGMSLLTDVLTGVISGGAFSTQLKTLYEQVDSPSGISNLCVAVRVESLMPLAEFRTRVDLIIDLMHACATAPGAERIYVPGEIEEETARRRTQEGIPINETLAAELDALGRELRQPLPFSV